ncbi:MAG: hypothetical protein GY822_17035 [Deltaproteobacteria bacterium]|nr:hypothetical protein [Deltaproteobacteria bacterium]
MKCGSEMSESADFCPGCAAPAQTPPVAGPVPSPQAAATSEKPKKKTSLLGLAFGGFLSLCIAVFLVAVGPVGALFGSILVFGSGVLLVKQRHFHGFFLTILVGSFLGGGTAFSAWRADVEATEAHEKKIAAAEEKRSAALAGLEAHTEEKGSQELLALCVAGRAIPQQHREKCKTAALAEAISKLEGNENETVLVDVDLALTWGAREKDVIAIRETASLKLYEPKAKALLKEAGELLKSKPLEVQQKIKEARAAITKLKKGGNPTQAKKLARKAATLERKAKAIVEKERKKKAQLEARAKIQTYKTQKGRTLKVPGIGYADGRDFEARPKLTVMNINVWDSAPRNRAVCSVRHGTKLKLSKIKRVESEDRAYFYVDSGKCSGWLQEPMLGSRKSKPVGDRF